MQSHYDRIETLVDIGAVLTYLRDLAISSGVSRMSYYVKPQFESAASVATCVFSHGYDPE